jgi:hypothetical protein
MMRVTSILILAVGACLQTGDDGATGVDDQASVIRQPPPPPPQVTSFVPDNGPPHLEINVGHDTILTSDASNFTFYNRYGVELKKVDASTMFQIFWKRYVPVGFPNPGTLNTRFLNDQLPYNVSPGPGVPLFASCDTSHDAVPDPDLTVSGHYQNDCLTNSVYDTHATYDPVHRRFILAGRIRDMIWQYPTEKTLCEDNKYPAPPCVDNPGPQVDPYVYRYLLLAVSNSEDPNAGFTYYSMPEYEGDWPRIGISGNYLVVSNHGESTTKDATLPVLTLFDMEDLSHGTTTPHTFPYRASDLSTTYPTAFSLTNTLTDLQNGAMGFLVVPAHDAVPDVGGALQGTAYVMSKSAHGEVPTLFAFVPNKNPAIVPMVAATQMPASYASTDPLTASIRGGFLYSAYNSGSSIHVDQQRITTTHDATAAHVAIQLHPDWTATIGTAQPLFVNLYVPPMLEVTGDGSAVVSYSMLDGIANTWSLRSTTFKASGSRGAEQTWSSGPFNGFVPNDTGYMTNRASIDPTDPQRVWLIGNVGNGGAYNDGTASSSAFVQSVEVTPSGCMNNAPADRFINGASGCGGTVHFDARESLCAPGYSVCTAKQWAAMPGTEPITGIDYFSPTQDYWTDDNLGYGIVNGVVDASTTSLGDCGTTGVGGVLEQTPMRVCTHNGSDAQGNVCNVAGCGLDGSSNLSFGGCGGDVTAGALCCPVAMGCASGQPDDVFSTSTSPSGTVLTDTRMVGCGGSVTWDHRANLCGPGYSVCKASQWAAVQGLQTVNGPPHASNDYWTDDIMGLLQPSGCEAVVNGGNSCGTTLNSVGVLVPAPMRVCTSSGSDNYGNACNIEHCGLGSNTDDSFGGCGNPTAGTLCCAD